MATDTAAIVALMNAGFVAMRKTGRYGRIVERAGFYSFAVARSISWDEDKGIGEAGFRRVHARVHDIYEREGINIQDLLRMARTECKRVG